MSASETVRAALTAALRSDPVLAGVAMFDGDVGKAGTPGAAVLPRIELGPPQGSDWSAVGMHGRELRTAVTVRVAEGQAGRLGAMTAAAERAGEMLGGQLGGWRVASVMFVRSRPADAKGMRGVTVEHRVRVAAV